MYTRLFIPFLLTFAAFSPLFSLFIYVIPDGLALPVVIVNYFAVIIFGIAIALAVLEEFTDLRKSKPVVLAAGLIWCAIAWLATQTGTVHEAELALHLYLSGIGF